MLKLASWNVNSLRVRLEHLGQWLALEQPDVLGLQETKLTDDKFPIAEIQALGYHCVFSGQPTYNGVAILAKASSFRTIDEWTCDEPRLPGDQKRFIAASLTTLQGDTRIRFINLYVPNGSEVGSEKYGYKLQWLDALRLRLKEEQASHPLCCVVGDFNIAPDDIDVHDPMAWQDKILCSKPERQRFQDLLSLGFTDSFRAQSGAEKQAFSWWDYRQGGFRRNQGMRIDHLLASDALMKHCEQVGIDRTPRGWEKPSDHAPALASFKL